MEVKSLNECMAKMGEKKIHLDHMVATHRKGWDEAEAFLKREARSLGNKMHILRMAMEILEEER